MIWIIPYMAVMSGWSGGSLKGHEMFGPLDFLPEILFALGFTFILYPYIGYWSLLVSSWAYAFMQTGHANALPWGKGNHNPDRSNTLSPVVKWICDILKVEYYSVNFCRIFMAVKGLLISLPIGGLGLLLWPLGYEIGNKVDKHVVSEVLSGAGIGLNLYLVSLL